MSKAGRPRKIDAKRYANGKLRYNLQPKAETAIYIQRERDFIRSNSRLAWWGTQIGILCAKDRVTPQQADAGKRFAEARAARDAALSLPPRHATAQDLNAIGGSSNAIDDEDAARRKAKAIAAYESARDCLDVICFAAVERVVLDDHRPDDEHQYIALVAGLNRLVLFYGMRG